MNTQTSNPYTGYTVNQAPVYAGFFRRVAALIIDIVIVSLVEALLMKLLLGTVTFDTIDRNPAVNNLIGWLVLIITVLYFALMESSAKQGTLGKMALGIQVATTDGKRMSFINALGRALLKILSLLFMGIGCLIAAFTKHHQAFHDFPVGTIVVRKGTAENAWADATPQWQPNMGNLGQTAAAAGQSYEGMTEAWSTLGTMVKVADQSTVDLVKSEFLQSLSTALNGAGIPFGSFDPDIPIKLKGQFILIDEGSRALRYFSSGLSGKARVETEGVLIVNGAAVANLHARHELGLGFFVFGGDGPKLLGTCAKGCGTQIARQVVGMLKAQR